MAKKQAANTEENSTRDRILQATVELMAEVGIDRMRTRAIAERAEVNPALIHYHFNSMAALSMEAAQHALIAELGPSIDVLESAATIDEGLRAMLEWIEREGQRTPGVTILAEAMVKATRDPEFRRWSRNASRRFRALILERLEAARGRGEIDASLNLPATAVLLAAALDGLLFHHLVDGTLDVVQTIEPIEAMLRPPPRRTRARRRGKQRKTEAQADGSASRG
ncbi:MAG: helix-turn-helix domain-containing protein [Solirubrobacterales bacterium]